MRNDIGVSFGAQGKELAEILVSVSIRSSRFGKGSISTHGRAYIHIDIDIDRY